jgi:hypothetical protein
MQSFIEIVETFLTGSPASPSETNLKAHPIDSLKIQAVRLQSD